MLSAMIEIGRNIRFSRRLTLHASVTLLRVGPPLGDIEGTFSGTFYDGVGNAHEVTAGSFRAHRPQGTTTVVTGDSAHVSYKGQQYSWNEVLGGTDIIYAMVAGGRTIITATKLGSPMGLPTLQIVLPDTVSGSWTDTTVALRVSLTEAYGTDMFRFEPIKSIDAGQNPPDTTFGEDSLPVVVLMHVTRVGEVFNGTFTGDLGRDNPANKDYSHNILPPEHNSVTGNFKATILRSGI